jgi:peroxiredoxin
MAMADVRVGQSVPREVADATVVDAGGARVTLASFWEHGPCVMVLLRHFACVGCAQQMTDLAPRLDELARAGVRTVLVGNGSRDQLATFVDRHALGTALVQAVTDPNLEAYRALDLVRSAWATIGPRSLVEVARAMAAGFEHRAPEGDLKQQGGVLLVDQRGVVRLLKRNRSIGDFASASDLVDAALRLAIERASEAAHV